MFGHLVDQAKLRATIAATHYGGLAGAAVLFIIAASFAVAAIFILIAKQAGVLVACVTMAVVFLVLAIVVAMMMLSRERTQRLALRQAAQRSAMSSAMSAGVASVLPSLLSGGRRMAKSSGLSTPLVLGSVVVAALLAMRSRTASADTHDE